MHKSVLFVVMLILSLLTAYASWEQFQYDELNSGKANGTGYFGIRKIINLTDSISGMGFQPLIFDADSNGKNEIVIFSGNYLKLFDTRLNLLNEKFVGNILGQPTAFNIDNDLFKEIIFISNFSGINYFFAYQYNNSGFNHEFNFTVSNGGIGSGIKCTALGSTNICVFMDNSQYVHIVNLTSKTGSSYNTSVFNDTREKIPAIGDLHNNGSLEAVFWFDKNGNKQYGLMAFDLINKNLDYFFGDNGTADDIVPSYSTNFKLKGHPVLADLNNDGKMEVAVSAFYDDTCNFEMCMDWFTELFVYNSSGNKLFSECEKSPNGDCNDGSSSTSPEEGTNPFVLDSNKDGISEICFIKDKKVSYNVKNMTINCYNYSGSKLLDSEISGGAIKAATAADMDSDGILDIITENYIYSKNGSSINNHGFGSNFAIPADIDGNGGLDLLFSKKSLTQIFIDDFGIVEIKNVSISPLIASSDDSLSCSFVAEGFGNLKANVSWYKNNFLQSTENNIECLNGTKCSVLNPILGNLTSKNNKWKCSVAGFNESFKSYSGNSEVKVLGKSSEWGEYCNSNDNVCAQGGISYFSNAGAESISNNSEGMEFEPLAADINNDGKSEIIIFSNSKLIIFNNSLGFINEKDVGTLVGQPAIYNIDNDNNLEIIFNANISSTSYLMAYEYNNINKNFLKQCNVSISNGLSGAGIKCADIEAGKSCFFKDQKNVFYNFNMTSCRQTANLTTNNKDDTKPAVPSILDYDNDGKLEGLWWFNNDSDNFMGIAVVELETMNFDTGFNEIGFIDDVIDGSSDFTYTPGYENVKGNPVFYQQDNAGGYEILVSWDNERYFHAFSGHSCARSNLKLFDTDGTLLWKNTPATGCPVGSSGAYECDISTPVIADADKDGYNDVCFIMEGDETCYTNAPDDYFYCLDRFGNNVNGYPKNTSDVGIYGGNSANLDTPLYIADMDNDNELEMISSGYIWELNGTILKGNYSSFTKYAPVPVDIDKNGVLELLGSKINQTNIFYPNVNVCNGRVQVQSIDYNNNYIPNTNIFVNNKLIGKTDEFGLFESQQSGVCGESLNYVLKCANNTVSCGTQTGSMDFANDFDSLIFDCTICTGNSDLRILSNNVNVSKENNKVTVNITIENVAANGINLTVKAQDKDTGLISDENSVLFNANSGDKFSIQTVTLNLNNADFVHVYVDANNAVNEPKTNNYVVVPVITNKRKAFISVDTGNPYADDAIKDYLSLFVIPTSDLDSSLTIAVGLGEHNSIISNKRAFTKLNYGWYADSNSVYYGNKPIGSRPWIGIVGSFKQDIAGDDFVFIMGKEIEGVVAAAKRLVNARDKFFVPKSEFFNSYTSIIEDTDTLGISVFDLMHNEENKDKFNNQRTPEFQKVVKNILSDNNFEVAIKTVRTVNDNTTLRIKNINSDFSQSFRDAVVDDTRPIVFSGGLWNNLFYWENNKVLTANLIEKGRDLWEIEITGGPQEDKPNSPNYSYNDSRDYYWPALIAGVQKYSNKNSLQYVGHSNGCGVALASLNLYSASGKNNAGYYFDADTGKYLLTDLTSAPVDTFVGIGCPGALDGYSPFYKYFGMFGDKIISQIKAEHVTAKEVSQRLLALCNSELDGDEEQYCVLAANGLNHVEGDFKVSKKLLIDYLENIKNKNNDPQISNGLSINRFRLYANEDFSTTYRTFLRSFVGGKLDTNQLKHDIVVSQQDSQKISGRISAINNIKLVNLTNFHHGRDDFKDFIDNLEVFLNEK